MRAAKLQRLQQLPPLLVRQGQGAVLVHEQDVEEVVVHRDLPHEAADLGRILDVHPPLQGGERDRAPVHRDDLTVQYGRYAAKGVGQPGKFRVRAGDVGVVAAHEAQRVAADVRHRPQSVPFGLVAIFMIMVGRWQLSQGRQHRPYQVRHGAASGRGIHPADHPGCPDPDGARP